MSNDDQSQSDKRTLRKELFLEQILRLESEKDSHYMAMTREVYNSILAEVEHAKSALKKTPVHHRRLKRFNVLKICETKILVSRSEPQKYYLPVEEIFDVIEDAHVALGHGGRDRVKNETSKKYANVTTEMINVFLSTCESCDHKKRKKRNNLVSKSILKEEVDVCTVI